MWPVSVLCEVLDGSRRGFYEYLQRHAKASVDAEEVALLTRVQAIAAATRHSYGRRRLATQLQDAGFHVGRAKARRLMHKAGVAVQRPRRRGPMTTDSRPGDEVAPKLLARPFDVTAPDHVWAGDITYLWTAAGGLYLSVLVDWYARKVVGWAMPHQMATTLVPDARQMALGRRSPAAGFMPHSDRGSQYASHAYQAMLADHGIVCRMSEQGECLDHAVAERFFGSLKREWTSHGYDATRQEARDDSIDYIEMFYHSRRKHSYLGYVSPNKYEQFALVA
jgi:transposase InsO family protein